MIIHARIQYEKITQSRAIFKTLMLQYNTGDFNEADEKKTCFTLKETGNFRLIRFQKYQFIEKKLSPESFLINGII